MPLRATPPQVELESRSVNKSNPQNNVPAGDPRASMVLSSRLGYVEGNTVQLKGRVACEINTCDELIATEMVFENVLESLDPPEIAGWFDCRTACDTSKHDTWYWYIVYRN